MKPYMSFKKLRGVAKEQLLGKYGAVIFAMLVYLGIRNLTLLLSSFTVADSVLSTIICIMVSIILDVLFGLFQYGLATLFLNISSERKFSTLDIFSAFKGSTDRILQISGFLALINFLCLLPYYVFTFCINFKLIIVPKYSTLLIIACFAFCSMINYLICLNFSQIYYMAVDLPGVPASKLIRMSSWLIKGSRFRFFLLQLSFLPIQFVGLLTFYIGFLWINPYLNNTYAHFYLDLSANRTNQ